MSGEPPPVGKCGSYQTQPGEPSGPLPRMTCDVGERDESASLPAMVSSGGGHAFISYVREDAEHVDAIERVLAAAGVLVWRDTENLWPGEDWKTKIREAITNDALAFIACFSSRSVAKQRSYQNEELLLAVEQFRQRQPNQPWLIPVRLDQCEMPAFDLGAGRTLDSLQRVDVFGEGREVGLSRLVATVLRILASQASADVGSVIAETSVAFLKTSLLDPTKQIAVEDFVMGRANTVTERLTDEAEFPKTFPDSTDWIEVIRQGVATCSRYWQTLAPLVDALVVGSAWGLAEHQRIWTLAVERVVNTAPARSGNTFLLALRHFPVLPLLYASGMAALHRGNFGALRAVAVDARFREQYGTLPLIGAAHVWRPFENGEVLANAVALDASGENLTAETIEALRTGRRGKLHTPVSDYLFQRLRKHLLPVIADDQDYVETFDRLEMLLAAMAIDLQAQTGPEDNAYPDGPWYGAYTWRSRYARPSPETKLQAEVEAQGADWPPVRAGLFGGDVARALEAMRGMVAGSAEARRRR